MRTWEIYFINRNTPVIRQSLESVIPSTSPGGAAVQ